jgi:hypothetical protein
LESFSLGDFLICRMFTGVHCRNFAPKLACYGLRGAGSIMRKDIVGRNTALRSYGGGIFLTR